MVEQNGDSSSLENRVNSLNERNENEADYGYVRGSFMMTDEE